MTELGSKLKEARQAKGLSLDDLQEITKIQKRYLKGIEEGNYDMMPGKFYVRAFIKQYAEAVDLETDQIFDEYKSEVPQVYNEDLPEKISRVQTRKTVSPGTSKMFEIFPKILVAVFILAAIVLVWYLASKYAGSNAKGNLGDSTETPVEQVQQTNKPNEKNQTKPSTEKNKNQEKSSDEENTTKEQEKPVQEIKAVSTIGNNTTYQLSNTDKFELKIVSTGEPWLEIKNGKGQSLFNGTINNGKSQTIDFSNEDKAILNIGRTTETEIYVNDEKIDFAVSPNDIVHQYITIQFEPSKTE
ncbi:helix-turn-helix domain-containing protein [Heyndrickxia sp. NPDC080065]|uniref:helix-turn-helix domain-containing protein n=1 Tax=Heyndrickxia sp. NPDC080065 TaxID=3390568 RepID=UPI003CFD858F